MKTHRYLFNLGRVTIRARVVLNYVYRFAALGLGGVICFPLVNASTITAENVAPLTYEYAGEWGEAGSGEGQFNLPEGLAVAQDGTVYVTDTHNGRVQYFSAAGSFLGLWDGTPPGRFLNPMDIAVTSSGTVYVTDSCGYRVQYFSPTGEYLGEWGKRGSAAGEFEDLEGLAIASAFTWATPVIAAYSILPRTASIWGSGGRKALKGLGEEG